MVVLDTNVVSELLRISPAPVVEAWLEAQNRADLYITSVSEAELRYGVAIMAEGRKRKLLGEAVENILHRAFRNRILPFDTAAAKEYARIRAGRKAAGRPIDQSDCQIAAIACAKGGAVATRDTSDFHGFGIEVINPWHGEGSA